MSTPGFLTTLCGLAIATACSRHPSPEPSAQLDRDTSCTRADSGMDLGQDVRRAPRYRVDSSGRVETLPPTPTAASDTGRQRCPAGRDTSGRER